MMFLSSLLLFLPSVSLGFTADQWLLEMQKHSTNQLLDNISPAGETLGKLFSTTDRNDPADWTFALRDAALAVNTLVDVYKEEPQDSKLHSLIHSKLSDHVRFLRSTVFQRYYHWGYAPNIQPKYPTAFPYNNGPSPQNDAPALQALSLIKLYQAYQPQNENDSIVCDLLFNNDKYQSWEYAYYTLIKAFVLHVFYNWDKSSYDLWETVSGEHFWNKMMQRKALTIGTKFFKDNNATPLNLTEVANIISNLEISLEKHWDNTRHQIVENLEYQTNQVVSRKQSGLDIATLLASLRGDLGDGFFSPESDRIQGTFFQLLKTMQAKFNINRETKFEGVAMGRFPEDDYDGQEFHGGNPWFVATLTASEYMYVVGQKWIKAGHIQVTEINRPFLLWLSKAEEIDFPKAGFAISQSSEDTRLLFNTLLKGTLREGDQFLKTVEVHAGERPGSLSQQYNRDTGFSQGMENYSWSLCSFVDVSHQRNAFIKLLPSL